MLNNLCVCVCICVFLLCEDGLIFAVNGESLSRPVPIRGFVIDYSTKDILDTFSPNKKVKTLFNTIKGSFPPQMF